MARSNENSNLRKASRPLSIIDENPDYLRGHSKTRNDVMTKQVCPGEVSSKGTPKTGHAVTSSRRKAVAPLQHPVDLLLSCNGVKTAQTMSKTKTEISNQGAIQNEIINTLPINNGTPSLLSDLDNRSDVNGNRHVNHDTDNNSFPHLKHGYLDHQFSDAGDEMIEHVQGDPSQSTSCADCVYNRTPDIFSNDELVSRTSGDNIRTIDERSKNEILPHSRPMNFSSWHHHSDTVVRTTTDERFPHENDSLSMFYLSNSTTSLEVEEDDDESEKKDKCKVENDTMGHPQQVNEGKTTKKMDVDAEQIEWKNMVKKSRSFIKTHNNSLKPMRRSLSATFNNSLNSDTNENAMTEHKSSPGTLRRFHSQQVDSVQRAEGLHKSKALISLLQDDTEIKSFSSLSQKNNSLMHFKNTPTVKLNQAAADQSNTQPIRRISAIDQSDFSLLKVTANRLHLQTRRPSVMAWKEKYMKNSGPGYLSDKSGIDQMKWTEENVDRINTSLSMLRKELIDLRLQDQSLARQFLGLRQAMNSLRLTWQCNDHKELLDGAEEDIEELRELSQLVDLPPELFSPVSSLQNLGITRMNLSSRRFSTC